MFSVIKLASETLTERYNPSLFNYFYETFPEGFWIAEKIHKTVGFIVGGKTITDTARILMLAVSQKHRKIGVGSILLKNFLRAMSLQNIKHVELEVKTENKQALKFYQNHGFKVEEIIPKFYQNGEDAYLMKKVI
jgi:ribosomal-protein-alanine N-acetyltransferase